MRDAAHQPEAKAMHTPGPWKRGSCDSYIIWAPKYRATNRLECPDPDEGVAIANINAPWYANDDVLGDERDRWEAETEANANLIAAAPDLLDGCNALLGLLQLLCGRDDVPPPIREFLFAGHRIDEARAAIAKATGAQP